jgi:hypothetical protein
MITLGHERKMTMNKLFRTIILGLGLGVLAFGQITTTQTTLSSALSTGSGFPVSTVCVASSTNIVAPGFGTPSATALMVDREYMTVLAATPVSTCWNVQRGANGTQPTAHASGAVVWVGPQGGGGSALGIVGLSPFSNIPPVANTPCTATAEPYLPRIVTGASQYEFSIGWVANCPTTGPGANLWQIIRTPIQPYLDHYTALDAGANNAVTASIPGLPQATGTCVDLVLAHTLQAGADTFALNGATAVAIKSHFNQATNLGTAYAVTGTIPLCYNGTVWLDMSE